MMKIIDILAAKSRDAYHNRPATIGIIGDSVSNGCFEVIDHHDGGIEAIYDTERNYAAELRKILMTLFPFGQVNIVNAAINGDSAPGGLSRIERDLLPQKPDLVIICYGLNDVNNGVSNEKILENYKTILDKIQARLPAAKVFCVSILPMNAKSTVMKIDYESATQRIPVLNGAIQTLAEERGYRFINLYPLLKDENNHLIEEYSVDGLHLSAAGYSIWTNLFKPELA